LMTLNGKVAVAATLRAKAPISRDSWGGGGVSLLYAHTNYHISTSSANDYKVWSTRNNLWLPNV